MCAHCMVAPILDPKVARVQSPGYRTSDTKCTVKNEHHRSRVPAISVNLPKGASLQNLWLQA